MGRGRAPCCDKSKVKRGPWSPAEDLRLITFIQRHGHDNWRALPKQAGLLRCGKSCRLRWINYLRPDVKRGNFTPEEEETIIKLHESLGNKWSKIASRLPGRTDNEIKNIWNTHLKKRVAPKIAASKGKESSITLSSSSSSGSLKSYDDQNIGISQGNEAKEPSSSNSSISCNSNVTNSSQVEVTRPPDQELMDSLFDSGGAYDKFEEANLRENANEAFDQLLPLESDLDFWNLFDSLGPLQSNNQQAVQVVDEVGICQSSNYGKEMNREGESVKWLRYLENELGLEATTTMDEITQDFMTKEASEPLVVNAFDKEALPNQETDVGMAYFQSWPSSPQNFVI